MFYGYGGSRRRCKGRLGETRGRGKNLDDHDKIILLKGTIQRGA
jgi:hypothetical protein